MQLPERFFTQPWHINPHAVAPLLHRLAAWGPKIQAAADPKALSLADFFHQRQPMTVTGDGIALIEVCGTLGRGLVTVDKILGDTDYDDVIAELHTAAADDRVKGILMIIDSPGGSVLGAQECREAVVAAEAGKPVVTYTAGMQCSAAYEISAGASFLMGSPSAIIGSIGTLQTRLDVTGYYEQFGVKVHVTPATQSDLKTTYNPQTQLTPEQAAEIQRWVDRWNDDFVGFVKAHRLEVTDASMRGQCFDAREAEALGLIDGTGSLDDAFDEVLAMAGVSPVDTKSEA